MRKFPYPYRCAFSIANDCDLMSMETFLEIYSFLCSNRTGRLGEGLDLHLSSSFFMYSENKEEMSYFDGLSEKESRYAGKIREYIQKGYLDTLHSFGNFSEEGGFRREFAEMAYKELDRWDLELKVWSNHGSKLDIDIFDSTRCVKHAKGDDINSSAYHADLTFEYGIRYIWQWHDGGLTNIIGQSTEDFYTLHNLLLVPTIREGKEKSFLLMQNHPDVMKELFKSNELLVPVVLKDGRKTYNIRRFNAGMPKVNARNIRGQISKRILNELIQREGYMVLYQHLGAKGKGIKNEYPYFTKAAMECLRYLSELYHSGKIFVTTLVNLLDYYYHSKHLVWEAEEKEGFYKIKIIKVKDDFLSIEYLPSVEALRGLTFYTPSPEKTEVFIQEKKIDELILNPTDYTGKRSISIPLGKKEPF